jgi:uncharacterized low-complexity protein
MENRKKSFLASSVITSAIIAATSFNAGASGLFQYDNLGSGQAIRANLLQTMNNNRNLELKCGEKGKTDSTTVKKGKDGKCGEGKCGGSKAKTTKKSKSNDKKGM